MNNTGWIERFGGILIRFPDPQKLEPPFEYKTKIAGFNLDNTIVESKPKLVADRYKFDLTFQNCIQKIQDLHKEGYAIVVISDQEGVSKGFMTVEDLRYKFDCFTSMLTDKQISVIGIFTTKNNCFKKPHTWTWKMLVELYKIQNRRIDMKESFYTGNLAGRVAKTPHKKDLDYIDRAFAHNIGLEFKVPEQVFLYSAEDREFKYENIMDDTEKDEYKLHEFERYRKSVFYNKSNAFDGLLFYCQSQSKKMLETIQDEKIISKKISFMIIMVGPPSCGKSFLAKILERKASRTVIGEGGKPISKSEFIVINDRHMIKVTNDKSKKLTNAQRNTLIDEAILSERLIILDGNYATHDSRKPYLEKASEYNVPVIFFKFDTPYKVCRHFNHMKFEETFDFAKEPLSTHMFKKYNKTYQPPDIASYKAQIPKLNAIIVNIPTLILDSPAFRNIY